ncbi:hypothetical protein [Gemella sp.]
MKKQVLLSVFAAALFAAPVASANNTGSQFDPSNKQPLVGGDLFTNDHDGLTQYAKNGLNNDDAASTAAKHKAAGEKLVPKKDANGKVIPGEFVVEGKAKDAAKKPMAPKAGSKAPAGKVLPKTSAAK